MIGFPSFVRVALLVALGICSTSDANARSHHPSVIDSDNVILTAGFSGDAITFRAINIGKSDLLIPRDFCFDLHLRAKLVAIGRDEKALGDFSAGLVRESGRMKRLRSGGGVAKCEIRYLGYAKDLRGDDVYADWTTNLFIGSANGTYVSKPASGLIRLNNRVDSVDAFDTLALTFFLHRKYFGVDE